MADRNRYIFSAFNVIGIPPLKDIASLCVFI